MVGVLMIGNSWSVCVKEGVGVKSGRKIWKEGIFRFW